MRLLTALCGLLMFGSNAQSDTLCLSDQEAVHRGETPFIFYAKNECPARLASYNFRKNASSEVSYHRQNLDAETKTCSYTFGKKRQFPSKLNCETGLSREQMIAKMNAVKNNPRYRGLGRHASMLQARLNASQAEERGFEYVEDEGPEEVEEVQPEEISVLNPDKGALPWEAPEALQ